MNGMQLVHFIMACSLIENINLRGLDAQSRLNIRYRRRPNDAPILNSSLNDNCAFLEPTETQIPNSMTQITSFSVTTSTQVENEPEFVTASKLPYTGKNVSLNLNPRY